MFGGNLVVRRYRLNNLVIASIGAVATLAVTVAITTPVVVGQVGWAFPIDAAFTAGIPMPVLVRATGVNELTLYFTNASAAPIEPADTFDFDAYLIEPTGDIQQTI